jgi:hypothetical protein
MDERLIQIRQSQIRYPQASLLGLPPELRDLIYDYCLPPSTAKHAILSPTLPLFGASLRRTCRQLYHETRRLSWARGALLIRDATDGDVTCTSINTKPAAQISRVLLQAKLPDRSLGESMMSVHINQRSKSILATHLRPREFIVQLCTCSLKDKHLGPYLMTMISVRYAVMALVNEWTSIEKVTFFYCDDSAPTPNILTPGLDWRFPSTWRASFGQDARYYGPWDVAKKDESLEGEEGVWVLKHYHGRNGEVTRSADVDFFNVADVYGVKCAMNVQGQHAPVASAD